MKKQNIQEENNRPIVVPTSEVRGILKDNMTRIQGNIYVIMCERNISQSELARAIESESGQVNRMLRDGSRGITIKVLGRIAKALSVPLKDLVA